MLAVFGFHKGIGYDIRIKYSYRTVLDRRRIDEGRISYGEMENVGGRRGGMEWEEQ